jgi:hypothetical protein
VLNLVPQAVGSIGATGVVLENIDGGIICIVPRVGKFERPTEVTIDSNPKLLVAIDEVQREDVLKQHLLLVDTVDACKCAVIVRAVLSCPSVANSMGEVVRV